MTLNLFQRNRVNPLICFYVFVTPVQIQCLCILCCLIAFPPHPFAYFLTSGYLLQTPHNSNSWHRWLELFWISFYCSSYRESTVDNWELGIPISTLSCVARRILCHKVNLPRCKARWRHFIVVHRDLSYFRHRANEQFRSMLFIPKNLLTAHSSSTQVTEINTLDQITALVQTNYSTSLVFKTFS